ncbi:MAG TPA: hypothetical protein VK530_05105 [Candidatus Acidoferrum sp.]|nr:hypothetical protein [Candidatus Acidoferrum sp.]
MNRSILIVICDFLLVTLVAFSSFDKPQTEPAAGASTAPKATAAQDVMGSLQMALQDEQQSREKLTVDLQNTRQNLQTQQEALAQRETRIKEFQENLRRTEEQARQIDQQRAALSEQVTSAQSNLKEVQTKLQTASTENLVSKEKLESLQNDLKRREDEAKALQARLGEVEKNHQAALAEKQQISAQLQVSEAEKRLTREQVQQLRGEVASVQQEKAKVLETTAKLADNVGVLATNSTQLTQEIRDNRALAPNTIYAAFQTNRITTTFNALRTGVFGRAVEKDKATQSILFSDGTQTYALFHVEDTPLMLWNPGTDWNKFTAVMSRGPTAFSAVRVSFVAQDPRVVVIPIGEAQAKQFGIRIYKTPADPFKFQDAVIVGANEGYYGECKFQIDPSAPQYVKVDRNLLKGLFGKFNPSRGDIVFTRTGEVLGVMVNGEYCALLNKVVPSRTILCGEDVTGQQTGQLLSQLYDRVFQMPQKLQ